MSDTIIANPVAEKEVKRFAIEDYLGILRYRKWLLIIPVVVLTLITAIGSFFMTDIFRAQTSILVTQGDVPDEFVRTTVSNSVQDRVATIREQILSQTLLLNVIQSFGLYPEMANRPTEELVGRMRSNVEIIVSSKNSFQIAFTGTDPLVVQSVTNRLAQAFIDETVGDRQKSAKATAEFLAQQLAEVKEKLDEQEKKVAEYKRQNIGMLPEQMEANQRNLDRLQQEVQSLGEQLAAAEDRKVVLETQMAQLQGTVMASGGGQMVTLQEQLETLQGQLKQLLQTLTPEHPDVKATQAKIEQLKSEIGSDQTVDGHQYRVTSVNRGLFERLQQTSLMIRSLNKQLAGVQGQIGASTSRVSMAPAVEEGLNVLMRDFDKLRETYQDLQKKHMEAQQAMALEAQQKGRQFKIIDEARFPEKPYKPNRPRLVALAFLVSLFLGIIAIFITEHMDHSFRDDEDLALFTGKPVLATIPRFTLEADERQRDKMVKLLITVAAAIGAIILIYVILKVGFGVNPLKLIHK